MPPRKTPLKTKKPTPKSKEIVESQTLNPPQTLIPAQTLDSENKLEQSVTQMEVVEVEMKTDVGSVDVEKDGMVNTTTTTTEEVVTTQIRVTEETTVAEEPREDEEELMEDDEEEPMEDDEEPVEEDPKTPDDSNNPLVSDGEGEDEGSKEDNDSEEDNKDEDPSELVHDGTKDEKDVEIFVGGLDKDAVEDDLIQVFGKFGEIKSARVARKSSNKRSKGFGFIKFASVGLAMHALSELTDGIEVKGKIARVSISQDKNTLHVSNVCDTWTKEQVEEKLKTLGVEHFEVQLPEDPENEGKNRGFAYLHFSRHPIALEAFQRLKKSDAIFGLDISAKVAFTKKFMQPNEDDLAQIKRVYVEGLTDDWTEEKMDTICKEYGEITEVKLVRNKRKCFCFISFTTRESALACVEGINNALIGEGDVKLKANLAKPQFRDRHQKQGLRGGGFAVHNRANSTPTKTRDGGRARQPAKTNRAKRRGKQRAEGRGNNNKSLSESRNADGGKPNRPQSGGTNSGTPKRKRENVPSNAGGRPRRDVERGDNRRSQRDSERGNGPAKKRRGNELARDTKDFRNPRRDDRARRDSYHSQAVIPSTRPRTDMEPHAGYLGPVAEQRRGSYAEYTRPPYANYLVPAPAPPRYHETGAWTQGPAHGAYHEPSVAIHGHPQSGYGQPKYSYDPYDRRLRRDDAPGSSGSTYGAPPPYASSYPPSYAGYEGHGGGYYQSADRDRVVPPRRSYY